METSVTAIEMRKKFGSILDRVVQNGEHITIMRGHQALATLVPAKEHEKQCLAHEKLKTIDQALQEIETWHQKNKSKSKRMKTASTTSLIRSFREQTS